MLGIININADSVTSLFHSAITLENMIAHIGEKSDPYSHFEKPHLRHNSHSILLIIHTQIYAIEKFYQSTQAI